MTHKQSAEVITVDFKTGTVIGRSETVTVQTDDVDPKVKFESFVGDFCGAVYYVAEDAFNKGVDYSRMSLVLLDEETGEQWVLFDHNSVSKQEVADVLIQCRDGLIIKE